ncbi:VanZ family protein [Alkalihalophilus marmarensis]|uniref:VanZ-like domain-containing protein n=1 Tax=Alkalihalophilus marmarensis DSM 21297 TaxID=1188261 RepID=U6SRJ2_9BACI|nr:VanZ family protein [Alkalihalophilus marmarensis]ERN53977.1 hypothetical protein A33I_09235 [Alkalihalophilus marmarensis DSM 21297]MCM3491148.1 VanZ family protein [Alkalihalophilus marmarensis]
MYIVNVVFIGSILIVAYFIFDLLKNRNKPFIRRVLFASFLFYLFNVLQQITGGIHIPPLAEMNYWSVEYHIQLVPFYFIADLINHYSHSGLSWFFWNAVKLSFFNVLLLLPLGIYLSIYKVNSFKKAGIIIIGVSFALETLQIVLSYSGLTYPRSFNVDDLLLNTLGGLVGYTLFKRVKKLFPSHDYKNEKVAS